MINQSRIDELNALISKHNQKYYGEDAPEISDADYDKLVIELRDLTESQGISGTVLDKPGTGRLAVHLEEVQHRVPMISLRTEVETHNGPIVKFLERMAKAGYTGDYVAEPKYDGLAISLHYNDHLLERAVTRGNGEVGEDVTQTILKINNIPTDLSDWSEASTITEVRGEVVLLLDKLKELNVLRVASGKKPYVNARNAAAGLIRKADHDIDISGSLYFIPYAVIGEKWPVFTQRDTLACLHQMFEMGGSVAKPVEGDDLYQRYNRLNESRSDLPFEIDGIVYKVNDLATQKAMGSSGREPRWAIAHKFPPMEVGTFLKAIDIQVGPTGRLTPVARLEPVFVGGTTVSNVTLSNAFKIRKKGIRVGDLVGVQRAGDVIPEITGIYMNWTRQGVYSPNFRMPKYCPVCGGDVVRNKGEANYHCIETSTCPAQKAGTLAFIVSRECLDIDGFGEALAQSVVDKQLIEHALDFIYLTEEDLRRAGLGPVESSKLYKEMNRVIEAPLPLDKFFLALGIPSIGKRASQKMAEQIKSAKDFIYNSPWCGYEEIEGLNSLNLKQLNHFLDVTANIKAMERFFRVFTVLDYVPIAGPLSGKSIVITGSAPGMSKDVVKDIIAKLGGIAGSSVSKNTSLVVYGDGAGDKLKKAESLGIERMTYAEFFDKYQINLNAI